MTVTRVTSPLRHRCLRAILRERMSSKPDIVIDDERRSERAALAKRAGRRLRIVSAGRGEAALATCRESLPVVMLRDPPAVCPELLGTAAGIRAGTPGRPPWCRSRRPRPGPKTREPGAGFAGCDGSSRIRSAGSCGESPDRLRNGGNADRGSDAAGNQTRNMCAGYPACPCARVVPLGPV